MTAENAIGLGALQGLTEFLPVSSSAHLVIVPALFGNGSPPLSFDILVHFGTLLSALVFFWQDVRRAADGLWRMARQPTQWRELYRDDPWSRMAVMIVLATVPTALIGVAGSKVFEPLFAAPSTACFMLFITAGLLLITDRALRHRSAEAEEQRPFPAHWAIVVGVAQGLAIAPGISRSGATLCTGVLLGLPRELAFRFAFLLMIPSVFGATLFEARDLAGEGVEWSYAVGALLAFVVGLAALWLLRSAVTRGRLWVFAVYCVVLAIVGLALLGGAT